MKKIPYNILIAGLASTLVAHGQTNTPVASQPVDNTNTAAASQPVTNSAPVTDAAQTTTPHQQPMLLR